MVEVIRSYQRIVKDEEIANQYLIPANVSTRFEFFEGFGWHELKICLCALVIGVVLFFVTGLFTKTVEVERVNDLNLTPGIGNNSGVVVVTENVPIIPAPFRSIIIIVFAAGAFFVTKRNPMTNMSLLTLIKDLKKFNSKQKRYLYIYDLGE